MSKEAAEYKRVNHAQLKRGDNESKDKACMI